MIAALRTDIIITLSFVLLGYHTSHTYQRWHFVDSHCNHHWWVCCEHLVRLLRLIQYCSPAMREDRCPGVRVCPSIPLQLLIHPNFIYTHTFTVR